MEDVQAFAVMPVQGVAQVAVRPVPVPAQLVVRPVPAVLEVALAVRPVEGVPAAVENVEDLVKQAAQDHAVHRAKQPALQHATTHAPERVLR